jgi:hypothetical protein
MSASMLQIFLSIGGFLIAAVGVPLVYFQHRDVGRSVRATTHASLYDQAAGFRSYFIEHPHLRKYFFSCSEIAIEHEDYDRVITIAEIFLNYLRKSLFFEYTYRRNEMHTLML